MIKKVDGIVISETDYKESSKIINILTKDEGIIGVIARGSKNLKSKTSGVGRLTYGYFHLNYRDNLSSLIEVDVINNLKNTKKDLMKISYATFISELVGQTYKHSHDKNIYLLFRDSLLKIEEGFDPVVITNILELKLLDFLGIRPVVDSCVSCGNTNNIVTISSYKGGYLCENCITNEALVTLKTIKLIRMFYYVDIAKISKIEIGEQVKKEINCFIDEYYDRYSGLYLKSKEFLGNINNFC